jgi:flavin reductase (DIM6/NTAB) family NADH-FMN oxidoreductase RutF
LIQCSADRSASLVSSYVFGVGLLHAARLSCRVIRDQESSQDGKTTFDPGESLDVPSIPGALAHTECFRRQIFIGGDHAVLVALVEDVRTNAGQPQL